MRVVRKQRPLARHSATASHLPGRAHPPASAEEIAVQFPLPLHLFPCGHPAEFMQLLLQLVLLFWVELLIFLKHPTQILLPFG